MEDTEIAYLLVILAQFVFMVCMLGAKQKQPDTKIEVKVVEAPPTPTEAPKRFRILDEPKPDRSEYREEIETEEYKAKDEQSLYLNPEMGMVKHLETAEGLKLIRVTCYLAYEGAHTADGTIPYEGICAGAPWRIGQDCILYDAKTLEPYARLECRDTGGHYLLQSDMAVDIYKKSYEAALAQIAEHGDFSYIRWVERGEE